MIEEERHKADETVIIPSTVAPEVSSAVKIDVSPTQVQSESDGKRP